MGGCGDGGDGWCVSECEPECDAASGQFIAAVASLLAYPNQIMDVATDYFISLFLPLSPSLTPSLSPRARQHPPYLTLGVEREQEGARLVGLEHLCRIQEE